MPVCPITRWLVQGRITHDGERLRTGRGGTAPGSPLGRTTAPEAVDRRVRWQELIRGERGEISPHAPPRTRGQDVNWSFDRQEYPGLAAAADAWDEIRSSRYKRWRLRRRLAEREFER